MKFIFAAVIVALLSLSSCRLTLEKLNNLPLEELRALALYGQSLDRKRQGIDVIFGGLEDYINSIDKSRIITIILGFAEQNPGIENYFDKPRQQSNEKITSLDKIVKFLEKTDLKTLRDIVVAADEFDRQKSPRFGGLAEVVNTLNQQQLIKEFVKLAIKNEELQDVNLVEELLKQYIEAIEFSKKFDDVIKPPTSLMASGLNFDEFDHEDLIIAAIIVDEYDRLLNPRFGGIAERAYSMNRSELIAFINEKIAVHPKLSNVEFLKQLQKQFQERLDFAKSYKDIATEPSKPKFSFDEVFNHLSLDKLRKVAVALDEYDREQNPRFGGLAEYVATLSKEELLDIIADYLTKYEELKSISFIESLVDKYAERSNFSDDFSQTIVNSIFKKFNKNELAEIALALEKIYKQKNNFSPIGGLHDYIWQLDEAGLINEITKFSKDVPEAFDLKFLEDIIRNNKAVNVRERIAAQPKETLVKIAIALEAFERESTNSHFLGGIHDYADRLTSEELLEFINGVVDKFPELEDLGTIEQVLDKYVNEEHHH